MPSRKKAKGKARRAAKEAKAAVEEEEADEQAALVANQDGSLEAQMQRLTIDNWLNDCRHGFDGDQILCRQFMAVFQEAYGKSIITGDYNMMVNFNAGIQATKDKFEFSFFWNDVAKLRQVVSLYVANGVQYILKGSDNNARAVAYFAHFFEEFIAVIVEETQPTIDLQQSYELQHSDLHTLVSFFRKRIPCKCLDEKYKEVKYVTKIGICSNQECNLPDRKVELKKMLNCSGCDQVCYCSRACQKAHWSKHKKFCRAMADLKAEFDSKQPPQQC